MTVCIYKFPFESVCRIWDIFLSEGIKIVFRVALAILPVVRHAVAVAVALTLHFA